LITSPPLKQNDFVVGALGTGQASRDIVKWGYSADVGDVSPSVYIYQDPVNYFNSKYVAVALKNTVAAGNPSVAGVKEEIAPFVKNLKKADIIKSKITSQDLASIASTFSSQVDTAKNVSFSSSYTPGLGNEPEVVSSAFNLDVNGVSKPIAGNNGVYIVRLIKKPEIGAPSNIPQLRKQTSQSIQSQISSRLIQAIKKDADIEDNRSRFY